MDEPTSDIIRDALVREAIALGALLGMLWLLGPGRVLIPAWITRARAMWRPRDTHGPEVRAFASEVSRWDHEQAAKAHRNPAAGGPCGCG